MGLSPEKNGLYEIPRGQAPKCCMILLFDSEMDLMISMPIDNPWLFGQIKHYLATGEKAEEPGIRERFEVCLRHLKAAVEYRGMNGMYAFRKHYSGYLKGVANVSHLRSELVRLEEVDRIEERMRAFLEDLENRGADVTEK